MGKLIAHEVALEFVLALSPVLPRLARRDRDLAKQLRRAAASVVLNLAEGAHSDPGNRKARFANAAGSAKETQSALLIAEAWGYISNPELLALADRLVALTYGLSRT
jgi:four helix bundle protein